MGVSTHSPCVSPGPPSSWSTPDSLCTDLAGQMLPLHACTCIYTHVHIHVHIHVHTHVHVHIHVLMIFNTFCAAMF